MGLVFLISNFFITKTSLANKWMRKKILSCSNSALIDVLLNSKWLFLKRFWPHYGLQVALRVWAAALILGGEFIILPTAARHSSNFKQKRTLQNRHAKFPKLARFSKILLICLVLVLRGWLATSN